MKITKFLAAFLIVAGVSACNISAPNLGDPNGGTTPDDASQSD